MLHAALIGFPSTGKSTLFQLMTSAKDAPRGEGRHGGRHLEGARRAARSPHGDVQSEEARPRHHRIHRHRGPRTTGAAALVDVAGYKNADALVHVVRAFRDPAVPHPSGTVDPARDAQAMEDELILADLGVVERRLERMEKDLKKNKSPELDKEKDLLLKCQAALENGQPLRALGLAGEDLRRLRGFQLLSAKPLLVVINLDEEDAAAAASVERAAEATGMKAFLSREGTRPSAVREDRARDAALEAADAEAFLKDMGLSESGLDRVIRASYDLLGYMSFFTVGEDECRAWSIRRGTIALDAAGEIHSDISRGFIRAEVVGYDTFIASGSLAACRDKGELRLEGKEYIVQDGDIINFRHAHLMATRRTRVTIVVPAFNEGDSIGQVVTELRAAAPWHEVLVVDDGSTDGTGKAAQDAGARVVRHPYNKGNGASVKTAIRAGDQRVDRDRRCRRPASRLRTRRGSSRQLGEYDLVVGARDPRTQATAGRRIGNALLNWLASYLTGRPIPDLTSGFRAARREYLLEFIHLLPNGFSTPTTTTLAFIKAGYNVAFEPIAARARVGTLEDPVRQRRRQVSVDLAEGHHHFQPASHLRARQRGVVRARRGVRRVELHLSRAHPQRRGGAAAVLDPRSCSSASCPSRSRRCVSRGDAPGNEDASSSFRPTTSATTCRSS